MPAAVSSIMKPVPAASRTQGPRALVAGAVGRRGEALLNMVLARGGYSEVVALAEQPVSLGISHLRVSTLADLPETADLFLLQSDPREAGERSFHGRDAAFVMADETNGVAIAKKAVAAGVQRIVLIAPAPMWQQFGQFHHGLSSGLERALGGLSVKRLVVLRPLRHSESVGTGFVQKIINVYLSVQMLMMPKTIPLTTSEQLARATLLALNDAQEGVSVFSAADIAQLLQKDMADR